MAGKKPQRRRETRTTKRLSSPSLHYSSSARRNRATTCAFRSINKPYMHLLLPCAIPRIIHMCRITHVPHMLAPKGAPMAVAAPMVQEDVESGRSSQGTKGLKVLFRFRGLHLLLRPVLSLEAPLHAKDALCILLASAYSIVYYSIL